MRQNEIPFLSRWSRLKHGGGEPAPGAAPLAAPAPGPLPDPATMEFGDDFSRFLCAEVEEGVRRAAMKKLFHSPAFNVMDGLDVYIDDYSIPDPIDEAMLNSLAHAREMLFGEEPLPAGAAATEMPSSLETAAGAAPPVAESTESTLTGSAKELTQP